MTSLRLAVILNLFGFKDSKIQSVWHIDIVLRARNRLNGYFGCSFDTSIICVLICSTLRIMASCSFFTGPNLLSLALKNRETDRWGPPQFWHRVEVLHSASECIFDPQFQQAEAWEQPREAWKLRHRLYSIDFSTRLEELCSSGVIEEAESRSRLSWMRFSH